MRTQFFLLATLLLMLSPAVTARHNDLPGGVGEYHLEVPDRDCMDCFSVSAAADYHQAKPCVDCASLEVWVEVGHDDEGTHVDAMLCRGGFFYFCLVDMHRTF